MKETNDFSKKYFERNSTWGKRGGFESNIEVIMAFYRAKLNCFRSIDPSIFKGNKKKALTLVALLDMA